MTEFYDASNGAILGSGISGSVRICTHLKTNTRYALKTLSKNVLQKDRLQLLREEIRIMAQLDHPNILRIHECFENAENIYLILELCTGGDLLKRINEEKHSHYDEKKACELVKSMLHAVRYCHEHGIVHRDLKLENFLFENKSSDAILKLIDFGFSQHFESNEILTRDVGSPVYVAPEVLEKRYDEKCDIWSLGVITYILLCGKPPFYGKNNSEILHAVKYSKLIFDMKYFQHISTEAIDFITKCLIRDYKKRPSATELCNHIWFSTQLNNNNNINSNIQISIQNNSSKSSLSSSVTSSKSQREYSNSMISSSSSKSNTATTISSDIIHRLQNFSKRNAFTKICLEVIAHTLTPEQLHSLREEFLKFDLNGSGEITISEMKNIMHMHEDISEEDIEHLFTDMDIEHTGKIHYHEFIAAAITEKEITEINLKIAFDMLSKHRDYIVLDDIVELLGRDVTDEVLEKMMKGSHIDPTHRITYPEVIGIHFTVGANIYIYIYIYI